MDTSRKFYPLEKCWNCCRTLFYILPCFIGVAALGLLAVEFYFDDIERDLVAKGIAITNGSRTFELMTRQTNISIHVHLFNITNSENVTNSRAKPILQTVGPYVYRSKITRTNITFTDECASKKCLQLSELTQLFFDVNKSPKFPENESVMVPDIVKVVAKNMADKLNFAARFAANLALSGRKDFHIIKASELLWDLNDGLLTIGNMLGMTKDSTIGVLRKVNNSIGGPFTINTGENDITKIGQVEVYKNVTKLNIWTSEYANMINGTTDVVSAPGLKLGEKRYVFSSLICRSLSFTATEVVFLKNFPQFNVIKMTLDKEQLQSVEENPDNLAFSDKDPEYPPSGFLSWTKCLDSPLPIFISMPYFHLVENETKNSVIFESPVEPNLEPYFLVDPKTGILVGANIHYQINIFMSKKKHTIARDTFIPIAYFKSVIYPEEEDIQMLYKLAYEFPATLRTSIRFSIGLLVIIGTLLFLFAIYLKCIEQRNRRMKSQKEHELARNELAICHHAF